MSNRSRHRCLWNLALTAVVLGWLPVHQAAVGQAEVGRGAAESSVGVEQARAMWTQGTSAPLPEGVHVRVVRRLLPTLTPAEVEALAQAVAIYPDHPDHRRVADERRRLAAGYEEHVSDVWCKGSGAWRRSETIPGTRVLRSDTVISADAVWLMTDQALNVLQPGRSPPPGKDVAGLESDVEQTLRIVFHANLGLGVRASASPTSFKPTPRGLTMIVESPAGLHTEYDIALSTSIGQPLVEEFRRYAPGVAEPSDRLRFVEWRRLDGDGVPFASRIERLRSGGRISEIWTIEARAMQPGEFESVTRVPSPSGTDPLRGPVTFRSVYDYRGSARTISSITPEGLVTNPMSVDMLGGQPSSLLRIVGWIGAGALLAGLVAIRIQRHRRAGVRATATRHSSVGPAPPDAGGQSREH